MHDFTVEMYKNIDLSDRNCTYTSLTGVLGTISGTTNRPQVSPTRKSRVKFKKIYGEAGEMVTRS